MKHCIDCGTELSENAKFCPSCGKKLEPQGCPQCGCTKIQAGIKFCPECGAKLASAEATVSTVPQPQKPVQIEEQVQSLVSTSSNNTEREQKREDETDISHKAVKEVIEDEIEITWKKDGISQEDSFGSPDIQNALEPFKTFVNKSFYYKFTDTEFDKSKIRKFIATLEKEEIVPQGYMIAPNAWIYYDDTLMGGGDNGFLVAKDRNIYFCKLGEKSVRIDFESIYSISYNKKDGNIKITYYQDLSSTDKDVVIKEFTIESWDSEEKKQEFTRHVEEFTSGKEEKKDFAHYLFMDYINILKSEEDKQEFIRHIDNCIYEEETKEALIDYIRMKLYEDKKEDNEKNSIIEDVSSITKNISITLSSSSSVVDRVSSVLDTVDRVSSVLDRVLSPSSVPDTVDRVLSVLDSLSGKHTVSMSLGIEGDKQEFVRLLADFIFHRRYLPPPEPDLAANPKDWREAVVTPAVLLTAMILAARADGSLNEEETARITEFGKQHMKPMVFGIQFKSAQTLPVDAGIIATAVNLSKQAEAARVYVYSCCLAKGGSEQERTYLDTLAQELHIPKATQKRLEQEAAGFIC